MFNLPCILVVTSSMFNLPCILVVTSSMFNLPCILVVTSSMFNLPCILVMTSSMFNLPCILVVTSSMWHRVSCDWYTNWPHSRYTLQSSVWLFIYHGGGSSTFLAGQGHATSYYCFPFPSLADYRVWRCIRLMDFTSTWCSKRRGSGTFFARSFCLRKTLVWKIRSRRI